MSRVETRSKTPASVFAELGSPTHLELISRLIHGEEHSIAAVTEGLDVACRATTNHLQLLQNAGVVDCRRVGRAKRYTIRPGPLN